MVDFTDEESPKICERVEFFRFFQKRQESRSQSLLKNFGMIASINIKTIKRFVEQSFGKTSLSVFSTEVKQKINGELQYCTLYFDLND